MPAAHVPSYAPQWLFKRPMEHLIPCPITRLITSADYTQHQWPIKYPSNTPSDAPPRLCSNTPPPPAPPESGHPRLGEAPSNLLGTHPPAVFCCSFAQKHAATTGFQALKHTTASSR